MQKACHGATTILESRAVNTLEGYTCIPASMIKIQIIIADTYQELTRSTCVLGAFSALFHLNLTTMSKAGVSITLQVRKQRPRKGVKSKLFKHMDS